MKFFYLIRQAEGKSFLNTKDTKVLFNYTLTGSVQARHGVFLTTKDTKILATHG